MPEMTRSCSTDHSNWNIDKNNRTYIDPWDLENYVYMKRRLSMNMSSSYQSDTSFIQQDGEPITSLSAKSDFYYVKPTQKPTAMLPKQQMKNIRRQSLIQEVSAGIDEQHFSNELYQLYGTNENKNNILNRCRHQDYQPKQFRRHSSITYSQYCQHQQQQQQQQNYNLLQRYQQYPPSDDLYTTDSYYGSTVGTNSWQNYNTTRMTSSRQQNPRAQREHHHNRQNQHNHYNHHDTSLSSSVTSSSGSPKPPPLLYLYQRRRFSQQPQTSTYHQRMMTPVIRELNEREEYHPHKNSITDTTTSGAPSEKITNSMTDATQTETEDNDTMIYHDDTNNITDTDDDIDTMNDNEIDIINDIINMKYRRISRQPKHFGLSNFGHLKIDYSCNWSNLDRYIGHS